MKIAIVDDCPDFAFIVEMQIRAYNETATGENLELDVYNSPVGFMRLMKGFDVCQYDIILIDVNMPVANGFEVRNQIRLVCNDIKIFLVSGTIYKHETFKDYQSIIRKDEFSIRDVLIEAESISRFMNNLEIDLYEEDTKILYI